MTSLMHIRNVREYAGTCPPTIWLGKSPTNRTIALLIFFLPKFTSAYIIIFVSLTCGSCKSCKKCPKGRTFKTLPSRTASSVSLHLAPIDSRPVSLISMSPPPQYFGYVYRHGRQTRTTSSEKPVGVSSGHTQTQTISVFNYSSTAGVDWLIKMTCWPTSTVTCSSSTDMVIGFVFYLIWIRKKENE